MKISLNWLSDYMDVSPLRSDPKGVLAKLTMRGLEVESVEDLSHGLDKVIISQIETRDKHPGADRLSVCRVNNGTEVLQIVCGAQNMKAGDKVALSMIGAHLPNGMKIEKGKIRDVESFGMLCSEVELGLADKSEGILILPKDAPVGKPLAPYLGRDDVVFELNVTPNRGDALSYIGVARELASILGQKPRMPKVELKENGADASGKIQVKIHNPPGETERCYQYHGRYLENVKVGPSPDWLVRRLSAIGLRSINNVVDITNYVLMELGTPLHAFDYKQIKGAQIQVRMAKEGEKLPLLDGTEVKLSADDLVIADAERAVALAGVMGGGNSEVTDSTTTLLLEAAQFSPATVRRTAKRHQKHSDSSYRFERQIDAKMVEFASRRAAQLFSELAGATVFKGAVSAYSNEGKKTAQPDAKRYLGVSAERLRSTLGLGDELTLLKVQECLAQVGFVAKERNQVEKAGFKGPLDSTDDLVVEIPSFRPDVTLREDIYEEVLRVWGYDRVEAVVPKLQFLPDPATPADSRAYKIERLKLALAEQGFTEVTNFAFTSKARNDRWGGPDNDKAVSLANPLNEEFTTMKTSLVGGLIDNLMLALNHQQGNIRLFEVRPVYTRSEASESGVAEQWCVSAVLSGRSYSHPLAARDRASDFYDLKGVLEATLESMNCKGLRYEPLGSDNRFHPAQSVKVVLGRGPCGVMGRLHPKRESEYKFKEPVYLLEVSLDRILEMASTQKKYAAISKFPKVPRDFSLLVPEQLTADKVILSIQKLGKPLVESLQIVDVYTGEKIPSGYRSLSVALILSDPQRTLEEAEVEAFAAKMLKGLESELGVKLRLQ